jgi:low affinity Fe/Cu permease
MEVVNSAKNKMQEIYGKYPYITVAVVAAVILIIVIIILWNFGIVSIDKFTDTRSTLEKKLDELIKEIKNLQIRNGPA